MTVDRILVDTTTTARVELYNDAGVLADPDGQSVEVTVTRADGTVVDTAVNAARVDVGIYSYPYIAGADPDVATLAWSGAWTAKPFTVRTYVQVASAWWFTTADLRDEQGLTDLDEPTAADLRFVAETTIEQFTRRAWSQRLGIETRDSHRLGRRWLLQRDGVPQLSPIRRLLSARLDGNAVDIAGWTVDRLGEVRTDARHVGTTDVGQDLVVAYVHGEDYPPPDLARAAKRLARHLHLTDGSKIPDRARMMTTEFGQFHLFAASDEYPTGVPEIDSTLRRYRHRIPSIA